MLYNKAYIIKSINTLVKLTTFVEKGKNMSKYSKKNLITKLLSLLLSFVLGISVLATPVFAETRTDGERLIEYMQDIINNINAPDISTAKLNELANKYVDIYKIMNLMDYEEAQELYDKNSELFEQFDDTVSGSYNNIIVKKGAVTTDSRDIMGYRYINSSESIAYDVIGKFNNKWKQTTCSNNGFLTLLETKDGVYQVDASKNFTQVEGTDLKVKINFEFLNYGKIVRVVYTVLNNGTKNEIYTIGSHSDVQIGSDDNATITPFSDKSGFKMKSSYSADSNSNNEYAQLNVWMKNTKGVTDVDGFWYGLFYKSKENCFTDLEEKNELSGIDSGCSFHWKDRTIAPSQTQTYSILFGIGGPNSEFDAEGLFSTLDSTKSLSLIQDELDSFVPSDFVIKDGNNVLVEGRDYVLSKLNTKNPVITFTDSFAVTENSNITIAVNGLNTDKPAKIRINLGVTLPKLFPFVLNNGRYGTVNTDGEEMIREGETVSLIPVPDKGYKFKSWIVKDNAVTVENNTFKMPSKSVEITPVFEKIPVVTDAKDEINTETKVTVTKPQDIFNKDKLVNNPSLGVTAEELENSKNIDITVVVKDIVKEEAEKSDKIIIEAKGMKVTKFFEIKIIKTITDFENNKTETLLKELPSIIKVTIDLPVELQGKNNYKLFRNHNDVIDTITSEPNQFGEYIKLSEDNKQIELYIRRFSTYAIGYNDNFGADVNVPNPSTGNSVPSSLIVLVVLSCAGSFCLKKKK